MRFRWKQVLSFVLVVGVPIAGLPWVFEAFGTPPFIQFAFVAWHHRQVKQAGGYWCFEMDSQGQPKEVLYGKENCEELATETGLIKNLGQKEYAKIKHWLTGFRYGA